MRERIYEAMTKPHYLRTGQDEVYIYLFWALFALIVIGGFCLFCVGVERWSEWQKSKRS